MPHYAYIDESGTLFDQQVMTISLLVLPSPHAHTKIHKQVLKGIHENYDAKVKSAKGAGSKRPGIHYREMENDHRLAAAEILAAEANVSVITCIHYHEGCPTTYDEFFARYQAMVKMVIADAIEMYEDLELFIAVISGPKGDYQTPLLAEIEEIRQELHQRLGFRKLKVSFAKAAMAGVQLADFYAGARREYLLPAGDNKSGAYELIEHHYSKETQD